MYRVFIPEIKGHIATISRKGAGDRYTLELNRIAWNKNDTKYDLRTWDNSTDPKTPLRGVTLTDFELERLADILAEYFEDGDEEE